MKQIDESRYPNILFCKLTSQAGEYLYGACSNKPYDGQKCTEYIRKKFHDEEVNYWKEDARQCAKQIPTWHDTSEELPEHDNDVNLTLRGVEEVQTGYYNHEDEHWDIYGFSRDMNMKVIAWMEFPQPFNPQEK